MRVFVVYGGMMFMGIWMFMFGVVGWSRFGRSGSNDKFFVAWFSWYKWFMFVVVVFVVIVVGILYVEILEIGVMYYDGVYGKVGLVIVVVACF